MGVPGVPAQYFGQLRDLLGQLPDLGGELDQPGVALGQRCLKERDPLLGTLSVIGPVAGRHTEVRSRSDPAVDPCLTKRAG